MIIPVILSGGSGSRLWPLSRGAYPKQLLSLVGGQSMLQDTLLRAKSVLDIGNPLLICNHEHRFLVAEQLQQIGVTNAQIILEPVGKNTAPAATIAALQLSATGADPLLLILPADHVIKDIANFVNAVRVAEMHANAGHLVTFGVAPTTPETGYGYIKTKDKCSDGHAFTVAEFVEKPNLKTAEEYVKAGCYFWNSGMFLFRASRYLAEIKAHAPEIFVACEKSITASQKDLDFIRLGVAEFGACASDSIDYAVMEKTHDTVVVPLDAGWSDVGSWSALWEVSDSDAQGNVLHGDVFASDVSNSYLRAEHRMLAVVGVSDHIVVETADAVLVAHKDNSQAIKDMVSHLKKHRRAEADLHRRVYRPWGHYETIDKSEHFQVKRITIKPGARLSLQTHNHRSEHWVIVSGVAQVTCGEKEFILTQNQSTYIPLGAKHRLSNPGKLNLELIEVQSGAYLGEDDIVRYEDVYGRDTCPV